MDAGQPIPAGVRARNGLRPALRFSARPAPEPALADAASGFLVRPVLAGGQSAVCTAAGRRAVPDLYARRERARLGGLFCRTEPPVFALLRQILGDFIVASASARQARKDFFAIFEKNYEKHLFFCEKIGYNKETKRDTNADCRVGRNQRCACANRHSLQSC